MVYPSRRLSGLVLVLAGKLAFVSSALHDQEALVDSLNYKAACPDFLSYSKFPHRPLSHGELKLPFQRPSTHCRTFTSPLVEKVISDMNEMILDKDLARIFENAFPNTLDTTVRWHVDGSTKTKQYDPSRGVWEGPHSFIVTGDINAEWLRDSTNQLVQYQILAKEDKAISNLILGAINTQAEFVIRSPYCNAFQPPAPSRFQPVGNGQTDEVYPMYEPNFVFECKYELDSLAHFLALGNQYWENTKNKAFLTQRWFKAVETVLNVIEEQQQGTFNKAGQYRSSHYRFQRQTNTGTETLNLNGNGNPLNTETGLVRSAFRPSDDATILGFLIPSNAMMAVELKRTGEMLAAVGGQSKLGLKVAKLAETIEEAVWEHGVVQHKKYGKVFAYEVDGYGSSIIMDDANLPSLLALPLLGFTDIDDETYKNTRRMLLDKMGNPYYLKGSDFHGIGGPHVGLQNAWPMSLLVQAMTSESDREISECLTAVRNVSMLGLVHETISVGNKAEYTRSWFAWANSVFAQAIIDIAQRKPHILFGTGAKPYIF